MLYKISHDKSTLWYLRILELLDFYWAQYSCEKLTARVHNENISTAKAVSYQTQENMVICFASFWSIIPICDCHNQSTKTSLFYAECTFSSQSNCLALRWYYPSTKKSLHYWNVNFVKECNQGFHYIGSTKLGSKYITCL